MASSSSSSHFQQTKHDVFISFRGSDIRQSFLSHLTKELLQKHIDAYVDDRLESGDEISLALVKAIEGPAISLIIFSEDYASSKWCLEELEKIIECKEVNQQIVIPVFYNIDPTNVRHQKGTFRDAFAQHEQRYNMDKLQSWRSALNKAANFSGYHYPSQFENESKLIDEIVKDLMEKLDDIYSTTESSSLVGFDGNLACIESLLKIESLEVRIVGLWGLGGIGKTTLARAICDKFSAKFESCCFLENIREESKKNNGLSYLLQKLFSTLLDQQNVNVNDVVKMKSIKRWLCRKKILLVLVDINTSEQLKYLAGEQSYLGAGSKVIITSRDKHVLISGGVHAIYEVKELNFQDSLKLFSLNAFNHSLPTLEYEELSKQAVGYAKGIPLVLKVLGSHLHSRDVKTWQSVMGKLKKHPNVEIQNVLKVSYNGLDYTEKEIFLDIAFFFKGENKDDVIRMLDACGFHAHSGIDILIDKALITISNYNEILMHDLLQEMGEQIVREESIKDSGRRSRLKDIEEVLDVLKNNKGTAAIEVITVDCTQINNDIHLSANVFNKMSNLRILKISSPWGCKGSSYVKLPLGPMSFPNELKYLRWDIYPFMSLQIASCAEKLVELCITNSHAQKLWDGVQDLVNLKKIDFSRSEQLIELPDFSKTRNLEVVELSFCKSLCSVHPSILSCHTLISLNLYGCKELRSLQSEIHFESLMHLQVHKCYNLKEFSLSSEKIELLYLNDTKIEMLHPSFGLFNVLSELYLNGSTLESLPINELCMLTPLFRLSLRDFKQEISKRELSILFDALPNLVELDLDGCINLFEIPDNMSALSRLERLILSRSGVETLPIGIKHLLKLEEVRLRYCRRLECLPELPPPIRVLDVTGCTSLVSVHNLPVNHDERPNFWECLFLGCMKMDEQSLSNVMEFCHVSMMRPPEKDFPYDVDAWVSYPGTIVPKWLKYKEMEKASITVELPPSSHHLLGFVCCCVLRPLPFTPEEFADITCQIWQKEVFHGMAMSDSVVLKELNTDHVFVWFYKLFEDDEITTSELEFRFIHNLAENDEATEFKDYDELKKECGICPIYDDTDDHQQLSPPTNKLKQSSIPCNSNLQAQ